MCRFVQDVWKVCSKKKWRLEIINISKSEAGGFKEVIFRYGDDIYSYLKYESGVHRVQRIPETETQGRVHTSAATVAVLPEAEEVDMKLRLRFKDRCFQSRRPRRSISKYHR